MVESPGSKLLKVLRALFTLALFLALVFIPAGTLNWPEAWIYIVLYLVSVGAVVLWLKKNNPGLLAERTKRKKDVRWWDRVFMLLYFFFLIVLLIITGLDAVRFSWSNVPLVLKIIGFLGFIPGFVLGFWAFKKNSYLSDAVRIQEDRGHKVCTTGPYQYVRHPMYAGILIAMFSFPFALGSFFALIPAAIVNLLFVFRTAMEDKTLHAELEGYKEYAEIVRFRLIPRVW